VSLVAAHSAPTHARVPPSAASARRPDTPHLPAHTSRQRRGSTRHPNFPPTHLRASAPSIRAAPHDPSVPRGHAAARVRSALRVRFAQSARSAASVPSPLPVSLSPVRCALPVRSALPAFRRALRVSRALPFCTVSRVSAPPVSWISPWRPVPAHDRVSAKHCMARVRCVSGLCRLSSLLRPLCAMSALRFRSALPVSSAPLVRSVPRVSAPPTSSALDLPWPRVPSASRLRSALLAVRLPSPLCRLPALCHPSSCAATRPPHPPHPPHPPPLCSPVQTTAPRR
jgi:hypothetical protein